MRFFVALATIATLSVASAAKSDAALVAGFNEGDSTVFTNGSNSLTITDVIATNGLATYSSGEWTTWVVGGGVDTFFDGSFQLSAPAPLLYFDFFAKSEPSTLAQWTVTVTANGNSLTETGAFSGSSTVASQVDLSSLGAASSGEIEFAMTGGRLVDGVGVLPQSGFSGFASVTAVPEPSAIAGMLLLSGGAFLAHRRTRRRKPATA